MLRDHPATFDELNTVRPRGPALGNPIFGFSTHPAPPPLGSLPARHGAGSQISGGSSASRARMLELQQQLEDERRLRKELEAQLNR